MHSNEAHLHSALLLATITKINCFQRMSPCIVYAGLRYQSIHTQTIIVWIDGVPTVIVDEKRALYSLLCVRFCYFIFDLMIVTKR